VKKFALIIIVFLGAVLAGMQASGWRLSDTGTQYSPPPYNAAPSQPDDKPDGEERPEPSGIPILGESAYLTEEQVRNMAEWRKAAVELAKQHPDQVFYCGPADQKMVALTFDDGPDEIITPEVLDVLREYDVKASFFFKGNKVKRYRSVVKRVQDEGHLVLSHAYSHQELDKMSADEISREITAAEDALWEVTGQKSAMLRPPFGAVNEDVIKESAQHGHTLILWSIDTLDWSHKDRYHIARNVLDNVRNGDIILMHSDEDKGETAAALPLIIEGLRKAGYRMVTLDQMLGLEAYKEQN